MLTSIRALRDSSAMQSRVSQVANNLKKINPNWKDEWFFPVVAVGLSNTIDDVEWVVHTPSVHMKTGTQHAFAVGVANHVSATAVVHAVKKHHPANLTSSGKTATVHAALEAVNAELTTLFGQPVDWRKGITFEQQTQAAPVALPDETSAVQTPAVQAGEHSVSSSPDVEKMIEARARTAFEQVFPDVDTSTSTNAKTGVVRYANDRTQGKFVGFLAALKAVSSGTIYIGDVIPLN